MPNTASYKYNNNIRQKYYVIRYVTACSWTDAHISDNADNYYILFPLVFLHYCTLRTPKQNTIYLTWIDGGNFFIRVVENNPQDILFGNDEHR